jgi:hypothetical protein
MFNFQRYLGASKPVAEHYDGHYLQYTKVSPTEFRLHRGLLPRYVIVATLENENTEGVTGTVLRDCLTGETHSPPSRPGDFLLFDNIRFRHSVPRLENPRVMVGMRCFDSSPVLFQDEMNGWDSMNGLVRDWSRLEDSTNPGWIRGLSTEEAAAVLEAYYSQTWPGHWETIRSEGALF